MQHKIQYHTDLQIPQLFFIFGRQQQIDNQLQYLVEHYKFSVIDLKNFLQKTTNQTQENPQHKSQNYLNRKKEVPRFLKKEIALQGVKRYVIINFPQDADIFREFMKIVGDEVQIKKIIKVGDLKECFQETEQDKKKQSQEDFHEILNEYENQEKVFKIDSQLENEQTQKLIKSKFTDKGIYPLAPVEVFFVSGGPGAGKGTQCFNLVKDYGFKHLSTGDLLRQAIKNGSKQGLAIDECIKNGKLVSSDLLVNLIKSEIARNDYEGKYLIDGFPRNVENDETWRVLMEGHADVKGLIYMKCGEQIMQQRILQRSKTSGRSDDNAETLKKRFKVYYNETQPIIQKYQKQNNVIEINAELTPQQVYDEIQKRLETKGFIPNNKHCKGKPSVILILGGPGSGKGTQCQKLVKEFGFKHLSSGQLLRDQVKQNGLNSELIEDYIMEGKLVPSKICVRVIKRAMQKIGWDGVYLIDGFPKNLQNIEAWQGEIGNQVCFLHTILFNCSEKVMEQRLLARGQTSGNVDDNPESIKKRFITFKTQTAPMISKYEEGDINIKINGDQGVEKVFEDLKSALIGKGLHPL